MKPIICNCSECRRHRGTRSAMVCARRKAMRQWVRYVLRAQPERWECLPVAFVVVGKAQRGGRTATQSY